MALSSSEIKVKSSAGNFGISLLSGLSLRSLQGIVVGLIACIILSFLIIWQPVYMEFQALEKEKEYWVHVMNAGAKNVKLNSNLLTIPTMDQLPDMIEKCCSTFVKEGVDVVTFSVERFGEKKETGNGASIDYALVRLHLQGQWSGIVSSLKVLEEEQEVSIHAQEVVLASKGGEALLQIYFCTGE